MSFGYLEHIENEVERACAWSCCECCDEHDEHWVVARNVWTEPESKEHPNDKSEYDVEGDRRWRSLEKF